MTDLFGNNENSLERKVEQSLKFIKSIINSKNVDFTSRLIIGNSGGKDSTVVMDLVSQIDKSIPSYHANTTIDPIGTIRYIKETYPQTEILNPKDGFYTLVKKKGLPTRLQRFCCERLKEYVGVGMNMFEGIRSQESVGRKNRDYIQCDSRPMYKGGQHIYPIYDWTEKDVWDYINIMGLKTNPNYEINGGCFKRIGCVGCPMAGKYQRIKEFNIEPKKLNAAKLAIGHGMNNNPQWKLSKYTDGNADLAIKWWLSGLTQDAFFKKDNGLFD